MSRSPQHRGRLAVAAAGLSLLTLVGCSAVEPTTTESTSPSQLADNFGTDLPAEGVQDGGTLTMALSSEPDTLDPTLSGSAYSRYVFASMCEKLYDTDENANVVPQLATDLPEVSDDGLTYTIPLRTDAVFADGTPMDAQAVADTLERNLTLDTSRRAGELGPLTDIAVVDDSHVALTYSEPYAPLPTILADRAGMILSPAALAADPDGFGRAPVCVGPFSLESWVPQTSITLTKDPNYYDADRVHLDEIDFRIIVDSSVRAANLASGEVQVADNLSTQGVDSVADDDGLDLLQSSGLGWRGLVVNIANTDGIGQPTSQRDTVLASEPLVREALSMSIDRQALVDTAFSGWYEATCSPIRSGSEFDTGTSTACPEYDPDAARDLLDEAGVQLPVDVEILGSTNPDTQRYLQALQAQVDPELFTITLDPLEESSLVASINSGDFEVLLQEWSGRADPDGNIRPFLTAGGSQNYSGYSTDEIDEALNGATETNDTDERKALYDAVMEDVQDENPIIYLFRQRNLTGVSEDVAGVYVYPDALPRLAFAAYVDQP